MTPSTFEPSHQTARLCAPVRCTRAPANPICAHLIQHIHTTIYTCTNLHALTTEPPVVAYASKTFARRISPPRDGYEICSDVRATATKSDVRGTRTNNGGRASPLALRGHKLLLAARARRRAFADLLVAAHLTRELLGDVASADLRAGEMHPREAARALDHRPASERLQAVAGDQLKRLVV